MTISKRVFDNGSYVVPAATHGAASLDDASVRRFSTPARLGRMFG